MVLACVVLPPLLPLLPPICDTPLYRSWSVTDQKSRRTHLSYVWTKALSENGFPVPLQKLSVIVWTWPKTLYLVHEPLEPG